MSNYFRFENETCPICQQKFSGNDDIVVCPVCGTPHHRDCYKQNGECGNFHKHNEGYRWAPATANEPVNEPQDNVPPFAGQPFNSQDASSTVLFSNTPNPLALFPKELEEDVLTDEAADFVQLSAIKYIQNFFYTKSKKKTFNWAAFFFAPYWFFYRKLYKLGTIFLAISLLLSVGFNLLPPVQNLYNDVNEWAEEYNVDSAKDFTNEELQAALTQRNNFIYTNPVGAALVLVQGALSLGIQIFIGFKANKWYYDHTIKSIRKIKSEEPDPQRRRLLFFKSGGAAMSAAFLALLASYTVTMAVDLLLTFIK